MRSTGLPDRHVAAACMMLCGVTAERTMIRQCWRPNPRSLAPCSIASRPLRAAARGPRPALTQSPLGAWIAGGPGRKAVLQAEQKASLSLQREPRLKNEKTPLSRTRKYHFVSATTILQKLTDATLLPALTGTSAQRHLTLQLGVDPPFTATAHLNMLETDQRLHQRIGHEKPLATDN